MRRHPETQARACRPAEIRPAVDVGLKLDILLAGEKHDTLTTVLGTVAVAASMTNIVSGFLITDRMLRMFKKREEPKP